MTGQIISRGRVTLGSEEWRCRECNTITHWPASKDWPRAEGVTLWCSIDKRETPHDRYVTG